MHFQSFDPVHKRTEATIRGQDNQELKVTKGAPQVVLSLSKKAVAITSEVEKTIQEFASLGFRSLGVTRSVKEGNWQFLGILPLFDPPREDTMAMIVVTNQMGVKVKIVTGDQLAIACETAKKLGLGTNVLDASGFIDLKARATAKLLKSIENADGFPQVFPEHKFHSVTMLKKWSYCWHDRRRSQ